MPNLGLEMSIDVDDDADGEVEDLVEGTGVLGAVGTKGKAWRRRRIKGIKSRKRRVVDGMSGTRKMDLGRAGSGVDGRNLGAGAGRGKGKGDVRGGGWGPGSEGVGGARESIGAAVRGERVALGSRGGDVRAHSAAIRINNLDGAAEYEGGEGVFRGDCGEEAEEEGDDDVDDDEGNEESDEGEGVLESEENGDEDAEDDDDDEELDGEGW